jgi:hypothetical protein
MGKVTVIANVKIKNFCKHGFGGVPRKWFFVVEELVKQNSDRPDVYAFIVLLSFKNFRCHVLMGAAN